MVSLLGLANLGLLTTRPRRIGGSWIIAHKKRTCGTGIRRKRHTTTTRKPRTIRKTTRRTTRKPTCGSGVRRRRIIRRRRVY